MGKLTEKEAISECKKLWAEIEKSGLTKHGFLNSLDGKVWRDKNYAAHCPLCEYTEEPSGSCNTCPLIVQYDERCLELGFSDSIPSTLDWFKAIKELK